MRKQAERPFVLGLAGESEAVSRARSAVLGTPLSAETAKAAEPFLCCASPPYDEPTEKRLRYADVLVSLPGGPAATALRPADPIRVAWPENTPAVVLENRPDLRVALARRLPGFRPLAAEHLIREVSLVNAEFSALSGVSQAIPFLAPLLPAVVGADIVLLTKNQIFMILRLGALYGEELGARNRVREIMGVIGSAFGWRTLARTVAGAVPGGFGLPLRVGVAYSGTYAVGRAAQMFIAEDRRPTRADMLRIYEEASVLARGAVQTVRERIAARRAEEPAPAALPEGDSAPAVPRDPTETPEPAVSATVEPPPPGEDA